MNASSTFSRVSCLAAAALLIASPQCTRAESDELTEARALLRADRLTDAEAAVRQILQKHADSADAHYLLGFILFNEQKPRPSLAEYAEAARYRPPSAAELSIMGCDSFLLGDYAAADKSLSDSVALDRNNAVSFFFLGRTRYMEGRFEDAARFFGESLKLRRDYVHAELFLALCYTKLGRISEAEETYKAAMPHATDGGPWRGLGALLASTGRVAEAIPYLRTAVDMSPAEARPHRELGKAYMKVGNSLDAQRELRTAADLDPKDPATRYLLAQVYRSAGLNDRAAVEAARFRELTGRDIPSLTDDPPGTTQPPVQQRSRADADKRSGAPVESENTPQALYELGRTKYNENRFEEAAAAFERCLKLDPRNVQAEHNLGLAYERLGRKPEAMAAFRTAISWQTGQHAQDAGPYLDLGRLTIDAHRAGEAVQYLFEAEKIAPGDMRIHRELGKAYLHMKMLPKARAELEKAVKLGPGDTEAHSMLAEVYRYEGLADKARTETQRYSALSTKHPADTNP